MASKQKFYAVRKGYQTGIFLTWEVCEKYVKGYPKAEYKSFYNKDDAEDYMRGKENEYTTVTNSNSNSTHIPTGAFLAVDGGTIGGNNSNGSTKCQYQIYNSQTQKVELTSKPIVGTNNIGEFLGIVKAIGILHKQNLHHIPIYSDSLIAIKWVKDKKAKTNLGNNNSSVDSIVNTLDMLEAAEKFLHTISLANFTIRKWETKSWGENPADFGRK